MLGGNLADIPSVPMRSAQMQHHRANVKALRLYMLNSVSRLGALYGCFIDHNQGWCSAGDLQQVRELWECLECEQVWLHWSQNQISAARRFGCIGAGVGRGIDHDEIDALNARLLNGSAEPCRMRGDNPGHFGVAAIRPLGGGRLRIRIEHGNLAASLDGCNRQGQGEGGFANTAFFSHYSNNHGRCIHVYTYAILLVASYTYAIICQQMVEGPPERANLPDKRLSLDNLYHQQ
jgi:hypothetical protein